MDDPGGSRRQFAIKIKSNNLKHLNKLTPPFSECSFALN